MYVVFLNWGWKYSHEVTNVSNLKPRCSKVVWYNFFALFYVENLKLIAATANEIDFASKHFYVAESEE